MGTHTCTRAHTVCIVLFYPGLLLMHFEITKYTFILKFYRIKDWDHQLLEALHFPWDHRIMVAFTFYISLVQYMVLARLA